MLLRGHSTRLEVYYLNKILFEEALCWHLIVLNLSHQELLFRGKKI